MRIVEVIAQEKVSFVVEKTNALSFVVVIYLNGKDIGSFGYTLVGDEAKNLAEIHPLYREGGHGKLLLLKAISTANDLKIPFYKDTESVSAAQSHVYDSLDASQYIMRDHSDEWYITENGYEYLKAHTE